MILRPLPDGGGTIYRLDVRAYTSGVGTHTFGVRSSVGGSNLAVTNALASETLGSGYEAANAFDALTGSFWETNTAPLGWVQGQVSGDPTLAQYAVGSGSTSARNPVGVRLRKSVDSGATFKVLDVRGGITFTPGGTNEYVPAQTNEASDVYEEHVPGTDLTGSTYSGVEETLVFAEASTLKTVKMYSPASGSHTLTILQGGSTVATKTASGGSGLVAFALDTPLSVTAGAYVFRLSFPSVTNAAYTTVLYQGYYFAITQMQFVGNATVFSYSVPIRLEFAR